MGRFMMGPYGCLVTKAIHEKHTHKEYIGVDACAANLMRPAMYGAYHHITVIPNSIHILPRFETVFFLEGVLFYITNYSEYTDAIFWYLIFG